MSEYYLVHYGTKGQHWGIRRWQNEDGTLTEAGKAHYAKTTVKKKLEKYRNSENKKLDKQISRYDKSIQQQQFEIENKQLSERALKIKQDLLEADKFHRAVTFVEKTGLMNMKLSELDKEKRDYSKAKAEAYLNGAALSLLSTPLAAASITREIRNAELRKQRNRSKNYYDKLDDFDDGLGDFNSVGEGVFIKKNK